MLRDLEMVLDQEQELWALEPRMNWIVLGHRNMSFFHVSTMARRKRDIISCIRIIWGNEFWRSEKLWTFVRQGFVDLYTNEHTSVLKVNMMKKWQACFSEEDMANLWMLISDEEIKGALWSLKPFKAPGPYGLHARFFSKILAQCGTINSCGG